MSGDLFWRCARLARSLPAEAWIPLRMKRDGERMVDTMVGKTNDDGERCEEENGKGDTAFAGPTTGLPMAGETVFAGVVKCVKIHCKV